MTRKALLRAIKNENVLGGFSFDCCAIFYEIQHLHYKKERILMKLILIKVLT